MEKFTARCSYSIILLFLLVSCRPKPDIQNSQYQLYIPVAYKTLSKKGLSMACGMYKNDADTVNAKWVYNWTATPDILANDIESIPMIWDETQIEKEIGGNSNYVMGFNEPDWPGQAELTPEQALEPWHRVEERFPDKLLVSIVNSDLNPWWLDQFRELYKEKYIQYPRFDVLALHCYSGFAGRCIEYTKSQIDRAKAWGINEIWVTEFGIWLDFINGTKQYKAYLDNEPMITRYAPFSSRTWCMIVIDPFWLQFALFDYDGNITHYGEAYK